MSKSPTVAFIGTGNMASAMALALAKSGGANIVLSNRSREKADALAAKIGANAEEIGANAEEIGANAEEIGANAEEIGANAEEIGARVADGNLAAATDADYILLGVKPHQIRAVIADIASVLKPCQTLVSMAAGVTLAALREATGGVCRLVRIMPNTPCAVGCGTVLYAADSDESNLATSDLVKLFGSAGEWIELPEGQIDAAGVLSGCGPAYAYEIIESLGDGGVLCGLPRALSYRLAARALLGAAALLEATGENPSVLKDNVTSPGGSTIEGLRVMEKSAVRSAMIEAVAASYKKNKELGK